MQSAGAEFASCIFYIYAARAEWKRGSVCAFFMIRVGCKQWWRHLHETPDRKFVIWHATAQIINKPGELNLAENQKQLAYSYELIGFVDTINEPTYIWHSLI